MTTSSMKAFLAHRIEERTRTAEAMQVLDGAMLSDGGLVLHGKHARLSMYLSDKLRTESHVDWLYTIASSLNDLGVQPLSGYPRASISIRKSGGVFSGHRLITETHPILTSQYDRWYRYNDDGKQVPLDVVVTPQVLAHWFMGDGCSSWKGMLAVDVSLATFSFNYSSLELLMSQLAVMNIHTTTGTDKRKKPGYDKTIRVIQDSVDNFMNAVNPFMLPSYNYKVKYRGCRQ